MWLARWLAAAGLIVTVAGCGSAESTNVPPAPTRAPSPAGSPVLGIDWGRAVAVERPAGFAVPSPGTSFSFSDARHPLHFSGQANMADIARLPSGALVSVGSVYPGWYPVAWTSPDGASWTIGEMASTEFTFPVAMSVGSGDTIVAVGRSGPLPIAWTSSDGRVWQRHPVATLGDDRVAERMTAVLATGDGYLAGGSVGPELLDRHARFWRSRDGATWQPIRDDAETFDNAEVRSIARLGSGYVAIGAVGSVQKITGSVAWVSADGQTWTRIDAPALAAGRAVSIVGAPFGGVVAVGSDLGEHEAFAWVSRDGRSWTLAPSEPSRQFNKTILMTDVTVVGDELIAVGKYSPLQRSTATSWVSHDGLHWERARSAAVQEQVELYAVVSTGQGVLAIGSFGGPDDVTPTVLVSPPR